MKLKKKIEFFPSQVKVKNGPPLSQLVIRKIIILAVLTWMLTTGAFADAKAGLSQQWLNSNTWQLQVDVSRPRIEIKNGVSCISLPGFASNYQIRKPILPVFVKVFNALPEEITYQLTTDNRQILTLPKPIDIFNDFPLGWSEPGAAENSPVDQIKAPPSDFPETAIKIEFVGYHKRVPLTRVKIFPCQVVDQGYTLVYHQTLSVRVTIRNDRQLIRAGELSTDPVLQALGVTEREVRRRSVVAKPTATGVTSQKLVRLVVEVDGIYRVSKADLIKNGIKLGNVDPRTFRLTNYGKEVPIFVSGESDGVFGTEDYIEFCGRRNPNSVGNYAHDPFTDKNVYWLSWGTGFGLRYAEESAKPTIPPEQAIIPLDFQHTLHWERNDYFERLGQVDTDKPTHARDHWFFDAGINGGTTKMYSFELAYPNSNSTKDFEVEVGMHGLTYQVGGHEVAVYVNDKYVGTGSWSDQVPHVIQSDPQQILRNNFLTHGTNKIQLAVSGNDPTNRYDKVLFDWVKVSYQRLYKAWRDSLDFVRPTGYPSGIYHFHLSNFSSPDISVYKVGKSKVRDFDVEFQRRTGTYDVVLQDYVHDDSTLYWAVSAAGIKIPAVITYDTVGITNSLPKGADILILIPDQWEQNLQKLTDFYEAQGLRPEVIGVRKVFNDFSHGIVTPFAIKRFLQFVYSNWNPVPDYVMFIGDAELREQTSVPPFLFQSYKFGACATDFWYTLADDDEVPDFALGRWPCSTAEELQLLIKKRINYTKAKLAGAWNNELLFIAGFEDAFKNQSEDMIHHQIGKEYNINRIYINPASENSRFFGGSDTLIYLFNQGLALGNFMGHGGGAVWGDRSLFNSSHIKYLKNVDRLPFLTSMTCFTGDWTSVTGLGEQLLLAEDGGAIGLWGATSVGWIKNDYLLAKPFYDVIFQPGMTAGRAIQIAKIKYLTEQDYFDYLKLSMLYSYNLIGDPTVALPFPGTTVALSIDKETPAPGDTVTLSGQLPFQKGEITVQLYDSSKVRVLPQLVKTTFTNGQVSLPIRLDPSIAPGNAYLNYYVKNTITGEDAHGVTLFNVRGMTFYGFECNPPRPTRGTNFTVSIYTDLLDMQALRCEVDTVSASSYLDDSGIEHIVSFSNPGAIISLEMLPVAGNVNQWRLAAPLSINTAGKLLALRFVATDQAASQVTSQSFLVRIKPAPELTPVALNQGGQKFPELITGVYYRGDDTINVKVRVERVVDATRTLFGETVTAFRPNQVNSIRFPGLLGTGLTHFIVSVDPDNSIPESDEDNNVRFDSLLVCTYPVLPGLGTSTDGISQDTLNFGGYFTLSVSGTVSTDSAAILLERVALTAALIQPAFRIIAVDSVLEKTGLRVKLPLNLPALNDAYIGIDLSQCAAGAGEEVAIGRWDPWLKIWCREVSYRQGKKIYARSKLPGIFSLIKTSDKVQPDLEINLDGQRFFQNSYVSDKPSISIIGEDANGVRFDSEGLEVLLDNQRIAHEQINLPDSLSDSFHIAAQFRPTLTKGQHTLKVMIRDAAGNLSTEEIAFVVSSELRLIDYGNYPNPFKDRTTFIYELTQRVKTLKIRIYTPSGRLIRVLEEESVYSSGVDMNEGGYHEVMWDGLDENGAFVANGVYFYKIMARQGDKTVSSVGKIAKTR